MLLLARTVLAAPAPQALQPAAAPNASALISPEVPPPAGGAAPAAGGGAAAPAARAAAPAATGGATVVQAMKFMQDPSVTDMTVKIASQTHDWRHP